MPKPQRNAQMEMEYLYSKAVEARNFHYGQFTKWQTFFYVAVGSVLVAYGAVITDDSQGVSVEYVEFLRRLFPVVGYVFSLIWFSSSKGYTYWWNAYMVVLKNIEKKYLDSKPAWVKDFAVYTAPKLDPSHGLIHLFEGANFSTSRLANAFAFISAWAWGCIILNDFFPGEYCFVVAFPVVFTWVCMVGMNCLFGSNIDDFLGDDTDHEKSEPKQESETAKRKKRICRVIRVAALVVFVLLIWLVRCKLNLPENTLGDAGEPEVYGYFSEFVAVQGNTGGNTGSSDTWSNCISAIVAIVAFFLVVSGKKIEEIVIKGRKK